LSTAVGRVTGEVNTSQILVYSIKILSGRQGLECILNKIFCGKAVPTGRVAGGTSEIAGKSFTPRHGKRKNSRVALSRRFTEQAFDLDLLFVSLTEVRDSLIM
jgi:hypothetical protein